MISPGSTSSEAADSACTPWKRLLTSRMTRSGSVGDIVAFGVVGRGSDQRRALPPAAKQAGGVSTRARNKVPGRGSERCGQHLFGVAGVEEAVGIDDHRRNRVAVGVFVQDIERSRAEARVALAGTAELAV